MHREAHGYWLAYSPQRKITRDQGSILEKAFWKMILATRDIEEVDEFLITNFMVVTNLNYFFEQSEGFRKEIKVMIEGQFEHDLYNKIFNIQLESEERDTLQRIIEWWIMVVDCGGPVPNIVNGYSFNELFGLYRKAIDLEMQEMVKTLGDRHNIRKKNKCKD